MIFQHDITGVPSSLPPVDLLYADVPYGTGRKFDDYDDSVEVAARVQQAVVAHAPVLLRPGGVVAIQCDHRANWHIRTLLESDTRLAFVNELVWAYNSGGAGHRNVPQKHDTILVFAKRGAEYTFNVLREPYPRDYGDRVGFHPDGRMITSVWNVPILSTTSIERTGYATEKPPALIERLLRVYSDPGDLVYDPCCGSGASGVAALAAGRQWIGSDINPRAVEIARARLGPTGQSVP